MKSGQLAEVGEEDLRPRAGLREHRVGRVAQGFERFGEADARQRARSLPAAPRPSARRGATSSTRAAFSCRLGNSLVPVSASLRRATAASRARRASRRHCSGSGPVRARPQAPPAALDLLEQRPCGMRKLAGQILDAAGAGGGIGDASPDSTLRAERAACCARRAARRASGSPSAAVMRQHGDSCRRRQARQR